MKRLVVIALLAAGCADEYERREPVVPDRAIPSEAELEGIPCPSSPTLMRAVTLPNGTAFCMDAFEASRDGTVGLGAVPASGVTFFEAEAACASAGKRLCTVAEWERACRGPQAFVYPYGDTVDDLACNGFYNDMAGIVPTGSFSTCGGAYGVYDLSGNVAEWTATATERIPGSGVRDDRSVRGGSYQANAVGLRCVGDDYHEDPATAKADLGFRCCL